MKQWELYIFPGGKVGERKTRLAVVLWMAFKQLTFEIRELRAINRVTGEHIVR